MRPFSLARIAAEAEGLRLKSSIQRTVTRVVMGVIGLAFLFLALGFIHITVWYWLRLSYGWPQHGTAAAIFGGDVVIAAILLGLAARSKPSRAEQEAREVRQRALSGITTALATSTLVIPAAKVLLREFRRPHA